MEEELYPEETQEKTPDDDSIYSERVMEQLMEDDELTSGEEGFMIGYLDA